MASGIGGFFFGSKPKVPTLPNVDPNKVQSETIASNLGASGAAQELASIFNKFGQDEILKALEFALPGGLAQIQSNIKSQLTGELAPQDTQALIRNATAAGYGKGFNFGTGGIGRNLVLRDLGIASQQQKQQGFQNFLGLASATKAPQFDYTSMFYTPAQRLSFAQQQADNKFNVDWLQSQLDAAPDPAGAFTMELLKEAIVAFAGKAGSAAGGMG